MEDMGGREVMFFDPSTGKLHTCKPTGAADPNKIVAVKMNDPESGGFFRLHGFAKHQREQEIFLYPTIDNTGL